MVLLDKPSEQFQAESVQRNYRSNNKLQAWILGISVVVMGLKLFAWWMTGSVAVLTDLLESLVNIAGAGIGLYSLYLSSQPSDSNHPYGHGKVEFISAAIEGTMITVAGLLMVEKGIEKLSSRPELGNLSVGLWLVGLSGLVNLALGILALRQAKVGQSAALKATGQHLLSDTYTTLALLATLAIVALTKIQWIDPVLAIALAILLVYTGLKILRNSMAGIMDEADYALLDKLVKFLNENRKDSWVDIHNLRLIKYGGRLHLDAHLTLPWYFQIREGYAEVVELNKLVDEAFGEYVEIFVHLDHCEPQCCSLCAMKDCPVRQAGFTTQLVWTPERLSQNHKHTHTTKA